MTRRNVRLKAMAGLALLGLAGLLAAGRLAAQPWDQEYEARAQEVVAGLARLNGLKGWAPNTPEAWPERGGESGRGRPGPNVAWQRESRPARLAELALEGLGLQRAADFSGLSALRKLEVGGNSLRGLNLDGDGALVFLGAQKNQLSLLNVAGCPELTHLAVSGNQLEKLDLAANPRLREVFASKNRLWDLDLSHNPALANLEVMNNRLTQLRVGAQPELARLGVSYNNLTRLDVSANSGLTELAARDNRLASLDLSRCPGLADLTVGHNELKALDLRANPALVRLAADQNRLTVLDLSHNPLLTALEAQKNPLAEIRLGENQLAELQSLNLDGCRLPLSQLWPLSGKARSRGRLGEQENVFFEQLALAPGQALDLTAEADLGGTPTEFTVLTDKKRRVRPDDYRRESGLITWNRPGRYLVMMTNERVFSSETNQLTGRMRTFKVKAYTGYIEVAPAGEKTEGEQ